MAVVVSALPIAIQRRGSATDIEMRSKFMPQYARLAEIWHISGSVQMGAQFLTYSLLIFYRFKVQIQGVNQQMISRS